MENNAKCILTIKLQLMKKILSLTCLFLGFAAMSQAQQNKQKPPKVNLENFKVPAAGKQTINKATGKRKTHLPKVDISNFKAPTKG
jgi:hypothetical protein